MTENQQLKTQALLDQLIEQAKSAPREARSCSMDFGCITAEYVYRMWGGSVPLEEIERAIGEVRRDLIS